MSNSNNKLVTIAGTRPEIIKLADFIPKMNEKFDHSFIYTGQHFSPRMKDIFIDELNVKPDYDFKCNSSDIELMKNRILPTLKDLQPEYVIIYGDTNSSMAAALAAHEAESKIIHLEAGIRDFDIAVPEESIRIKIDEMASHLFAPSDFCRSVLSYENVTGNVYVTGNLIVDVCLRLSRIAANRELPVDLPAEFLLLTIHRPENADNPENLKLLIKHFEKVKHKIIFPVHPRTQKSLKSRNIQFPDNVIMIDPVGYIEFLGLLLKSKLVLTDSGGLQEESVTLKKPCITLRHTSARWETILLKANVLFPPDTTASLSETVEMMLQTKIQRNPYGDDVANKTVSLLEKIIN